MQSRTIARELALLMLGQISDRGQASVARDGSTELSDRSFTDLLHQALAGLHQHVREALDRSAEDLQAAEQHLLDSELQDAGEGESQLNVQQQAVQLPRVRQHLKDGLTAAEQALNRLSAALELPRVLLLADQTEVRRDAIARAKAVLSNREQIDHSLDRVMEGWRLMRLPRIDRDILRLAAVDLQAFGTPPAVACNEAVELAHRYSDEQGRRMIHGVLRRLTNASTSS
ncbi:MAG: transcription antitermination protein NusB [Cyanobacteria bacterium K_DeepCast_35m_m2_023]|nr:transcription antitermination protein NusB [Cyanobacteria bacterium K_DeepCast_35m_m2_023]